MSARMELAKMKEQIDKALSEKELGAAAFKAGDYVGALKKYHFAICYLKGLKNQESFRGVSVPGTRKFTEIEEGDEEEDNDDDSKDNGSQETKPDAKASKEAVDDICTFENVKKTMAACYVNMAICHSKAEAWAKCKRAAESALEVDKDNFKAKFRVAQATVRLGEIAEGRRKLQDLLKEQDDPAIRNELKVLSAAEAVRDKKHKESFKGFFKKASADDSPAKQTNGESSTASTLIPPNQPRFTELEEEDAKPVEDTPIKPKEGEPVLPPTPPKSD